jgi:hypothetical protein
MDVAAPPAHGDELAVRAVAEVRDAARFGLVGVLPTEAGAVPQAARRADDFAGLQVVGEEVGARTREEQAVAVGVEAGELDGHLGQVERLQDRIRCAVDLCALSPASQQTGAGRARRTV